MKTEDIKNYLSQYPKGKITYGEAELREAFGAEIMDKAAETVKAKKLLETVIYAALATSNRKSTPWNTVVLFACDKNYNFYWISSRKTVHSVNIEDNEKVALTIYDTTSPAGMGFGVYVKATASVVEDKAEIVNALKLLLKRDEKNVRVETDYMGNSPRKVYKAVPELVWVNDLRMKKEELKYLRLEISLK